MAIRGRLTLRPRGHRLQLTQGACILALLTALAATGTAQAAIPQSEREVLLALYESTNGDEWNRNSGWNGAPGTECSWYGVSCDDDLAHVVGLSFSGDSVILGNGLEGVLPPLSELTELQRFGASDNDLSGPITFFEGLAHLQLVFVGHNQFTGPIPQLSGFVNLQVFEASDNELNGSIPLLNGLKDLRELDISDNNLSGNAPNVPEPNNLIDGGSNLCPNALNPVPNVAWDAATGVAPWYQECAPVETIFADGFDVP